MQVTTTLTAQTHYCLPLLGKLYYSNANKIDVKIWRHLAWRRLVNAATIFKNDPSLKTVECRVRARCASALETNRAKIADASLLGTQSNIAYRESSQVIYVTFYLQFYFRYCIRLVIYKLVLSLIMFILITRLIFFICFFFYLYFFLLY